MTPRPDATSDGAASEAVAPPNGAWQRLDRRMIVIDGAQVLVSFVPLTVVAWVFGGDTGGTWPAVVVAITRVVSAGVDAYRWATTTYRVTDEMVERRSGLVVRSHRSVRRDRIRNVDIHAKLRHRLGGLRIVTIGAGQQRAAGEAALDLDAVSIADAHALRAVLGGASGHPGELRAANRTTSDGEVGARATADPDTLVDVAAPKREEVLARFQPRWVVHNVFSVWAYVMTLGLVWGAWWLLPTVGLELGGIIDGIADWESLGPAWTIAIGLIAATVVGVMGLGANFFVEYGNFVLARVDMDDGGTALRTRQGLLTTRDVTRDDRRLRGVQISEPLCWRWMGTADTTVITTGLDMYALSQPAAILPRGPLAVARPVAAAVLGADPSPLDAALRRHPPAALRRRLWWATLVSAMGVGLVVWLVATAVIAPLTAVIGGIALWSVALGGAVIAYRSLGHAITGRYLVVRSGLASRATTALQRSAVSTVAVRESPLQRRLGLRTVTVMTSAGTGEYAAPDLDRDDALAFAADAAPAVLAPFLVADPLPAAE